MVSFVGYGVQIFGRTVMKLGTYQSIFFSKISGDPERGPEGGPEIDPERSLEVDPERDPEGEVHILYQPKE